MAEQEAGSEKIAGAGGVDDLGDRLGRHFGARAIGNRHGPVGTARHREHGHLAGQRRNAGFEVALTGQRCQLVLVGEENVDLTRFDQLAEIVAVARDDESVGQGEGDLAARALRGGNRLAHGRAGLFRIPQVAFEIEHGRIGNGPFVERFGRQELRGTEVGVHRALAIGADEDQATRRRRLALARGGGESDAAGADVVGEDLAQLVVRDLADEGAVGAQRGEARQRVRRRAARDFPRRAHRIVELTRTVGIDERHAAAHQAEFGDQLVGAGRHDIDDGIADGDHVDGRLGHAGGFPGSVVRIARGPSRRLGGRQAITPCRRDDGR